MINYKFLGIKDNFHRYSFQFEKEDYGIVSLNFETGEYRIEKYPFNDPDETTSLMFKRAMFNRYKQNDSIESDGMFAWW